MSLFSDLISGADGVYSITNRPDLIAETALSVRQATLAAHRSDLYPRDRFEQQLTITPAAEVWQLDIPSVFTRWRKFSYIRPFDALTSALSKIVLGRNDFLEPDAILDEYLEEKLNIAYIGGNNLNIRFETAFDGILVGYWQNPLLLPEASYESWIARDFPAVVVLDAARRVFGMIGYEEAASRLNRILFGGSEGNWNNIVGGEVSLFRAAALESAGG